MARVHRPERGEGERTGGRSVSVPVVAAFAGNRQSTVLVAQEEGGRFRAAAARVASGRLPYVSVWKRRVPPVLPSRYPARIVSGCACHRGTGRVRSLTSAPPTAPSKLRGVDAPCKRVRGFQAGQPVSLAAAPVCRSPAPGIQCIPGPVGNRAQFGDPADAASGSPPRSRGGPAGAVRSAGGGRSIPALAGKPTGGRRSTSASRVHPRARGEAAK